MHQSPGRVECRYYGRDFTAGEMALLRALIAVDPQPTRAGLSREFCRLIGWFKPDGGLKDMMARVTMLAMHRDGLVVLPPPKGRQHRPKPVVFGPDTEPPLLPAPTTLDEVRPIDLPPRRPRDPRGQAVERVRRPLPLSRLQDPRRRPDARVKGGQEMPGTLPKTIPREFRNVFWKRFPGNRNAAKCDRTGQGGTIPLPHSSKPQKPGLADIGWDSVGWVASYFETAPFDHSGTPPRQAGLSTIGSGRETGDEG